MKKTPTIKNKNLNRTILMGFFLILIVNLISISLISAMDWDNRQKIEDTKGLAGYNNIQIGNFFGYGKTLWSGTLDSNTESCSNNCEAVQTITLHESGVLIEDIAFETILEDGSRVEQPIRSYEIYANNQPYTLGTELELGTYEVKLKGKKKSDRIVDWVYKTQGETLNEWANWGASTVFNDAIVYWKMDTVVFEGENGTLIEEVDGIANFTNVSAGIPDGVVGILENGSGGFDGTTGWVVADTLVPNHYNISNASSTLNFWLNWTGDQLAGGLFAGQPGGFNIQMLTSGKLRLDWNGMGARTLAQNFTYNQWHMITIIQNDSNQSAKDIYVDGILNETFTYGATYDLKAIMEGTTGFKMADVADPVDGLIDEIGIWNVSLTASQIAELYNSGNGLAFEVAEGVVTLNSPADNHQTVGLIDFNCSAIIIGGSTLVNMSLYSNFSGAWEQINTTDMTGTSNITEFSNSFGVKGKYLWNCVVCDSDDDCGTASSNRTFEVTAFNTVAETYTTPTLSGENNLFEIELETNGTAITIAYLNYNNTNFLGSISSVGNNYNLTRTQTAPGVETSTNIPFYWNVTMADGFSDLTTEHNQTVNPIVINGSCGPGMFPIFNFTLADEVTQARINQTSNTSIIKIDLNMYTSDRTTNVRQFFGNFNSTNPVAICIDDDLTGGEQFSVDIQVEYSTLNHSTEIYNIERWVLNETTLFENITLYDLDKVNAQEFKLIARDSSYLPIGDALIQIERKYIENGSFFITEIPRTNSDGIASASLELDDVIYNFYIYQSGILLSSFTNVLAICQTPVISTCEIDFNAFQEGIAIPDYETMDDFSFTLEYNDTTRIVSSEFLIPSGEPSIVLLQVIREDTLGTAVCTDTLTSASGELTCAVPNTFGNATLRVRLFKDSIEQGWGNVKLDQTPSDIFGVVLIMLSVLVLMTLIGMGVSDNPVVTGVFLFVGVVLMAALNLIGSTGFIGATASILFLAIAIIIVIIKAARRS